MNKAVSKIGREIFQQTKRRCTGSFSAALTAEDAEWAMGHQTVKPFEQIPGHRSYPIIGTTWAMFPVIGS